MQLLRTSLFVWSPCFICLVDLAVNSCFAELVSANRSGDASVAHYDHARFFLVMRLVPAAAFTLKVPPAFLLLPPSRILPSYRTLAIPFTSIAFRAALPPHIAS